jgi:hypothetical protein
MSQALRLPDEEWANSALRLRKQRGLFSHTLSHNPAYAVFLVGFSNPRARSCVLSALPN